MALQMKLNKPSTMLKLIVQPLKGNCPHDEGILHKKSHQILSSTKTQGPPNESQLQTISMETYLCK